MTWPGFECQCFHEQMTWPWPLSQSLKWWEPITHLAPQRCESVAFTSIFYHISFTEFGHFQIRINGFHYNFSFLTLCISNGNCISHTERIFLSSGNVFTVQITGEKCQWSSDPFSFVCLSQGEGASVWEVTWLIQRFRVPAAAWVWLINPRKDFPFSEVQRLMADSCLHSWGPSPHSSCSMR